MDPLKLSVLRLAELGVPPQNVARHIERLRSLKGKRLRSLTEKEAWKPDRRKRRARSAEWWS